MGRAINLRLLRNLLLIATATLLIVTLASTWFTAGATVSKFDPGESWSRSVNVAVQSNSLVVAHWPRRAIGHFEELPQPGWKADWNLSADRFMSTTGAWWVFPRRSRGGSSRGPFVEWQIPLLYPLIMLGCATGWSVKRVRKSTPTACKLCGYELVDLPSCPECGPTPRK